MLNLNMEFIVSHLYEKESVLILKNKYENVEIFQNIDRLFLIFIKHLQ